MKVTILGSGTSGGVPLIGCQCKVCKSTDSKDKRLRTSALIEVDELKVAIDIGPDFRQQILRTDINKLDAILLTHGHRDHIGGLDDIRALNFTMERSMPFYLDKYTLKALKEQFAYVFKEYDYPGIPQIQINPITNKEFSIQNLKIQPIEVLHYKLPVTGYRVKDLVYITDANYISPEEKEKAMNAKVLILNALQKEEHISHFTLQQAIELSEELKSEKTYFTHISHKMGLHEEVQKELPPNVYLAYDGLEIEV